MPESFGTDHYTHSLPREAHTAVHTKHGSMSIWYLLQYLLPVIQSAAEYIPVDNFIPPHTQHFALRARCNQHNRHPQHLVYAIHHFAPSTDSALGLRVAGDAVKGKNYRSRLHGGTSTLSGAAGFEDLAPSKLRSHRLRMSLIQGFAVQKWIRDRGWTKETAAVAVS